MHRRRGNEIAGLRLLFLRKAHYDAYLVAKGNTIMFLLLAIILVLAWLGGFTLMHVSSLLIHLLLIFAVISLIMHFIGGRKTA